MARMNRIQFQPGLSIDEMLGQYGTEEQCEAALEQSRWPGGFECPRCGGKAHCVVWHDQVKTFQCNACHQQTTLTSGTIFHATKLSLRTWFLAMYFLTQTKNNVSALELTRLIGVCYRTAWRLKHKILQVIVGAGVKPASTSRHKSGASNAVTAACNFGLRAQREGRPARGQRRSVQGLTEDGF